MATTTPTTLTLYVSPTSLEGSSQGVPVTFSWSRATDLLHGQTVASAVITLDRNGVASTDLNFTAASIDGTGLLVGTLVGVATIAAVGRTYSLYCAATLTDGTGPLLASVNVQVLAI